MKHYGDITALNGAELPVVDCITGGSPCQDLSIAGRREGLAGERSGLFMEQVRIVKEMREEDKKRGRTGAMVRPRFLVWENVPGAFSSNKGRDFQAVLTEIVRIAEPEAPDVPLPDKGKWPKAGCLYDDLGGWSVAWRVHDAQFWGVPQRRKRIALVADFGGLAAPEALFERKGLSGDSEPGRTAREETAAGAGGGVEGASVGVDVYNQEITGDVAASLTAASGGTNTSGPKVLCRNDQGGSAMNVSEDVTGALRAQEPGHRPVVAAFMGGQGSKAGGLGYHEEVSPSLKSVPSGGNTVPTILFEPRSQDGVPRIHDSGVVPTLNTAQGGQRQPCVLCVGNGQAHIASHITEEVCQTLNCMHDPMAVFIPPVAHAIRAKANCDFREDSETYVCRQTVRRLTPLECERLQGYPDGWTSIGEWVDSKGKKHREADSPRYKALGNSIALPFWFWLLRRISAQYERPATLGSLFDGIGGFPLCWECCNGRGTALWASEIEEFPIAVTKKHFPE